MLFASLGGRERASEARWTRWPADVELRGLPERSKKCVAVFARDMLYGCSVGEVCMWLGSTCSGSMSRFTGFGVLTSVHGPNFASVRESTVEASSGSSTPQRFARTLRIPRVRRAQSQPSAISSRCFTPWVMSRFAFFSGRFSRWIVQAECAMYTTMLQIWRRP